MRIICTLLFLATACAQTSAQVPARVALSETERAAHPEFAEIEAQMEAALLELQAQIATLR